MTVSELIKFYSTQVLTEGMEFSQIKKKLEYKDLNDDEIIQTLILIDKRVNRELKNKVERKKGRNEFLMGLSAFVLGGVITSASLLGFHKFGGIGIVTIGLFSFGSLKMFTGAFKMKA